jgi:hypothetical protein
MRRSVGRFFSAIMMVLAGLIFVSPVKAQAVPEDLIKAAGQRKIGGAGTRDWRPDLYLPGQQHTGDLGVEGSRRKTFYQ